MARVRTPLGALRKVLGESPSPIWMLDDQRVVVYINQAVEAWCGVSGEQLIGKPCDYSWESADDSALSMVAALAPPPEIYPTPRVVRTRSTSPDQETVGERSVLFVPLLDREGQVQGILGMAATADGADSPSLAPGSEDAAEARAFHLRLGHLRRRLKSLYELPQLIGESAALHRVRDQVELAAQSGGRVVVQGPAGSGRERVARTIHYLHRSDPARFLIPLSCSLLDVELLEAAIKDFLRGPVDFEVESPLSLLLLDADQLSPEAQASLMNMLRDSEHDVHTLTTTQRSLTSMAANGEFRVDLAHHLSTLVIELPPLQERQEDIPLLVQYLVERNNSMGGKQLSGCSTEAIDCLTAYEWPGNLDQLTAFVREAWDRADGSRIEVSHLPAVLEHAAQAVSHSRPPEENIVLDEFLERIETELLRRALRRSRGNRARAARLLGISRARLLRRLTQLRIEL